LALYSYGPLQAVTQFFSSTIGEAFYINFHDIYGMDKQLHGFRTKCVINLYTISMLIYIYSTFKLPPRSAAWNTLPFKSISVNTTPSLVQIPVPANSLRTPHLPALKTFISPLVLDDKPTLPFKPAGRARWTKTERIIAAEAKTANTDLEFQTLVSVYYTFLYSID
jgi:hypothetical protein